MRLGITVDMSGAHPKLDIERVKEAERLGFSQAWTGEAYGTDAVTPATWMLAHTTKLNVGTGIMQIPARTPAMAAMTAMTLQHLSGGRFLCGLGVSGPQVIEGWHGTRFGKPMTRTKEYIAIMRQILERKGPLVFKGEEYEIPYAGPDATGLGKPLRSITHGDPALKFYLASITPAGLAHGGRVRRRRAADLLLSGTTEDRFGSDPGRQAEGRTAETDGRLRCRALCAGEARARRGRLPRPGPAGARAVYRRHGRAREELLQRRRHQTWFRGRRRKPSRTITSTAKRTKPPRRFPTS